MWREIASTIIFVLFFFTPKGHTKIDELLAVDINHSKQWLLIRGEDISKPLVLFIHGGPGSPLMLFSRGFDHYFIKDFTVVHWDQRNSGKSYDSKAPIQSFSLNQVASDGIQVTSYLKKRFRKDKVILVGHSWGSIVAGHMAKQSPEDFSVLFSVGTVADMKKGDELKYNFIRKEVNALGSDADRSDFKKLSPPPWVGFQQILILSKLMTKFKGTFYGLTSEQINTAVGANKEYSPEEMENLGVAMAKIWKQIFPFLSEYKAIHAVPRLEIPVVFIQGKQDMATPTSLAKQYFESFQSTKSKKWVEFSSSAHFPMYEEPQRFLKTLKENL